MVGGRGGFDGGRGDEGREVGWGGGRKKEREEWEGSGRRRRRMRRRRRRRRPRAISQSREASCHFTVQGGCHFTVKGGVLPLHNPLLTHMARSSQQPGTYVFSEVVAAHGGIVHLSWCTRA